jgi:hypothetical protein
MTKWVRRWQNLWDSGSQGDRESHGDELTWARVLMASKLNKCSESSHVRLDQRGSMCPGTEAPLRPSSLLSLLFSVTILHSTSHQ